MPTTTYVIKIRHQGLNQYRTLKGQDKERILAEAHAQHRAWSQQWTQLLTRLTTDQLANGTKPSAAKKVVAAQATKSLQRALAECEQILHQSLNGDHRLNFASLKSIEPFNLAQPNEPDLEQIPLEPSRSDPQFRPRFDLLDLFSSSRRVNKAQELDGKFSLAYTNWAMLRDRIKFRNAEMQGQYESDVVAWQRAKQEFVEASQRSNKSIDEFENDYRSRNEQAVQKYCEQVLRSSKYPGWLDKEFDAGFDSSNGTLIVDFKLPAPEDVPDIREIKYVAARNEFEDIKLSSAAISKLYDSIVYQIALRTIHEMFSSDVCGAIGNVIFNGWAESTDPGTGRLQRACIVSVQVPKADYEKLHLASVDPKICFRALKGIGAAQLHGMVPVQPILSLNRKDRRFVPSKEVVSRLSEGTNLASLGWEEFEHLIRQLFEKEFSREGNEVKVTQSSRDGGVDAVVFDPDPIHGGKIVVQAKRYTNTVGVGAVRDLYGTVLNEGASKGILVTTSSFGQDAYAFAQNKPLTLLDGSNLVYLLAKHGYKTRIDLDEAKALGTSMRRYVGSGSDDQLASLE